MHAIPLLVAGITLLTVIGIAYGGTFVLRVVTGKQGANELQKSFFRAGHAHAGVLVVLGLVVSLLVGAAGSPLWGQIAGYGVLACALVIPGGFFLSVLGRDPKEPNGLKALLWIGFGLLSISLAVAGIAVIVSAVSELS